MKRSAVQYKDVTAMSLQELLALTLRERRTQTSKTSDTLLKDFGSLRELVDAAPEELVGVAGVNAAKAVRIKAVLELARRYASQPSEEKVSIKSSGDVARLLGAEMRHLNQEHFRVVLLDSKNQVIQVVTVSIGTLNATLVHPREVFRLAIKRSCAAVILVHSHPSGVPTPSPEDLSLTRRLVDAGKLLGIEILDHVIIGDARHCSLREQGMMS